MQAEINTNTALQEVSQKKAWYIHNTKSNKININVTNVNGYFNKNGC